MNWVTRTQERRDLVDDDDVVVGRVRMGTSRDDPWVASIAEGTAFKQIGEGTLQEAQHLVAQEATRRLRAYLLQDSAARFGLDAERPGKGDRPPERATGLRLIRGGADDQQGE